MERFQIYLKEKNKNVYSYSITRIDEKTNTYKLKFIFAEYNQKTFSYDKYKIKEFHIGIERILSKIEKIDFEKKFESKVDENLDFYQISFGDKEISSNNKEDLEEYLDFFNFLEICKISKNEYPYIKDINEYIVLRDILLDKCKDLEQDKLQKIIDLLTNTNPYDIFENFENFSDWIVNL